jgi:hypothetical protein
MFKWTKRILVTGAVVGLAGAVCFGTGLPSYLRSSGRMLKSAVKESIPIEFEIQRARDCLEDLIPESQANLRLVAMEEVEVANLSKEIQKQRESVADESGKIQKLRSTLNTQLACYQIGGREYRRNDLVEELARRFDGLKTAEALLAGKEDLLKNRNRSLDCAIQKLEKTKLARLELASQIEALEGQFRLMQAQTSSSQFHIDDSRLAQTQKVISEIKNRLEVAQRVLVREAQFIEAIPIDAPNESQVVERVDSYFAKKGEPAATAIAVEAR